MKGTIRTEEQIIGILQEHEAGAKYADLCRKHGMSEGRPGTWCRRPRARLDEDEIAIPGVEALAPPVANRGCLATKACQCPRMAILINQQSGRKWMRARGRGVLDRDRSAYCDASGFCSVRGIVALQLLQRPRGDSHRRLPAAPQRQAEAVHLDQIRRGYSLAGTPLFERPR